MGEWNGFGLYYPVRTVVVWYVCLCLGGVGGVVGGLGPGMGMGLGGLLVFKKKYD